MSNDNNIINFLIEDVNKKDKEVEESRQIIKFYKTYSLTTSILLIIVLIELFVNIDTMKLVVVFIFLIMVTLIIFMFKED